MNSQTEQNKIVIGEVLKEAWQLVSGLKWPAFLITILFPLAYFVFVLIFSLILIKTFLLLAVPLLICLAAISFVAMWCMLSIMIMLGVRQAIGLSIDIKLVISQCWQVKEKLFSLFMIWAAIIALYVFVKHALIPDTTLGVLLDIAFYLVTLYATLPLIIFAIPLVVTKRVNLQQALEESYNIMHQYWIQILACYIIMAIIGFISAIPLGIGLIWTIPMHYAMLGILFRNAYGLKKKPQNLPEPVETV